LLIGQKRATIRLLVPLVNARKVAPHREARAHAAASIDHARVDADVSAAQRPISPKGPGRTR
jgi:hypothetical protein